MKKTIYLLFILLLCISCQEVADNIFSEEDMKEVSEVFEQTQYNEDLKNFSLAIGRALKGNKDFRNLIKNEALKRYDGDFDVLLSHIASKPIMNNNNQHHALRSDESTVLVKDLLNISYNIDQNNLRSESSSIIDELMKKYPDLQISIPIHADDWDEDSDSIPIITFIPEESVDGVTKELTGYDQNENIVMLDALNAPDFPVIVIGQNERAGFAPIGPSGPIGGNGPITAIDPRDTIPPTTPTNLRISTTAAGITLQWNKRAKAIGYYIYKRKYNQDDFQKIRTVNGNNNTIYDDIDVEAGRTYSYYISAYNYFGESEPTDLVTAVGVKPASLSAFSADIRTNRAAELRWTMVDDQYVDKVNLSKYIYTNSSAYTYEFVKQFERNDYDYIDTSIVPGTYVNYKMQIETATGVSTPLYDFVKVPYRDPSKPSPVRIKKIKCSESTEDWYRGSPEFSIKVLGVNTSDRTKSYEIQSEIRCIFNGNMFKWNKEQSFDILAFNWQPDLWYDAVTFYVVETDKNENMDLELNAQVNYKKDNVFGTNGLGSAVTLKGNYKFLNKGDDEVGYYYLNYFDEKDQWLEFPNHGVYILIGTE